ncbi:MAG: hypothetical protein R3B54_05715 [Bdellovibrionota bacterium]
MKAILLLILFFCLTSMAEVMEPVPRADNQQHFNGNKRGLASQNRPVVAPEVEDLVNTVEDTNAGVSPSLDGFALPRRTRNTGELNGDPGFQDLFGN